MSVPDEEVYVQGWIKQLSIRTRSSSQKLRYLSGGNQQKVVLARWLVDGMKLLIMEEPTRGVDVGARKEIYAALRQLSSGGLGILMISSDVEEVATCLTGLSCWTEVVLPPVSSVAFQQRS